MIDNISTDNPGAHAVKGLGMRPFPCWDCGFESRQGHGYLSVALFVCCEVQVLWRADHSSRESYRVWCVAVCDLETSSMRRPWATLGRSTTGIKSQYISFSSAYDFLLKVQFSLCLIKQKPRHTYWEMEINSTHFYVITRWSVSRTGRLTPRKFLLFSCHRRMCGAQRCFEYLEDTKALWLCCQSRIVLDTYVQVFSNSVL